MTRLKESIECLKRMHEKKYITVPSVNENVKLSSGNTINILVGNTNDPINLTYGERTGACMRIGGAGSTLFDFCLTNENGFHISFNDPATGAFVSRVSCFRNGNTLFLNQLRDSVNSKYSNEDIIEACKIMGQKLIELTKDSKYPIENVVASNGYALRKQKTVELDINNVQKGLPKFYTDVSSSGVVVVATSNNGELLPVKPNPNGALRYQIGRGIVRKYDLEKANSATKHIEALDMLYEGYELDDISTSDIDLSYAYVGEDWYVGRTISGEIVKYIQKNSLNKEAASKEIEIYEEMVKSNAYGGILL